MLATKYSFEPDSPENQAPLTLPPRLQEPSEKQEIKFSSKAEMAAGLLLEKYLPDFTLIPDDTFQVPIGAGKVCDFKIGCTYVEYHPLNLHFDFDDRKAYRQLTSALKSLDNGYIREQIIGAIRSELAEKYYRRRKLLIGLSCPSNSDLVVVENASELHAKVIRRFATVYPREKEFVREFETLRSEVEI